MSGIAQQHRKCFILQIRKKQSGCGKHPKRVQDRPKDILSRGIGISKSNYLDPNNDSCSDEKQLATKRVDPLTDLVLVEAEDIVPS